MFCRLLTARVCCGLVFVAALLLANFLEGIAGGFGAALDVANGGIEVDANPFPGGLGDALPISVSVGNRAGGFSGGQ
jgi:hypothetical protein